MPSGANATTRSGPMARMCPLVSNPLKGHVRCSACTQGTRLPDFFFLTVFVAVEMVSTLIDVSSIRTKWAEVVFPGCSEPLRTGVLSVCSSPTLKPGPVD